MMLFAVLAPAALIVASVAQHMMLARRLGGPLEQDLPDADVYWDGKGLPVENVERRSGKASDG